MNPYPPNMERLLRLARHAARHRAPAPAGEPDAAEIRRLAQQALRTTTSPGASREERAPERIAWAGALERLCWWGAGVTAAVCLFLGAMHRPPPEPEAFELLLEWPAASNATNPELF